MRRLFNAITEWLKLRARLREERQFHLDCAAADLRDSGLTAREAKRRARSTFGRRSFNEAAIELGCDLSGLAHLIRTSRALASGWLQPVALLSVVVAIFLASPKPRELANSVFIRVHRLENRGATILNLDDGTGWYTGTITGPEFAALQTMSTLSRLDRYRGSYAWGQSAPGATLATIQSEARRITGNSKIVAEAAGPQWELLANPAQSAWLITICFGAFFLFRHAHRTAKSRSVLWQWLMYGVASAALHITASLAVSALTLQLSNPSGPILTILFLAWLTVAAIQCRYWWIDLRQRCPQCFELMVLPLTEGAAESMILSPAITESVCTHGHGVLAESRWSSTFRPEESPLESFANFS